MNFFDSLGIIPKIKNNYYYPLSNQAFSIKNALLKEAELRNVNIKLNKFVKNLFKNNNKFIIECNDEIIHCDDVIIATGSKAYPKTGSDGSFYELLKKMGHTINPVLPALVALQTKENVKNLSGVRCEVILNLYNEDKFLKSEVGELQFTDYGLSGICIYNLSNIATKLLNSKKKVNIKINFLYDLSINNTKEFIKWFDERNAKVKNRNLTLQLEGFLNYKVVNYLLKKHHLLDNTYWNDLSTFEKENLAKDLIELEFNIDNTLSFDKSQICLGGISLKEINLNTMESLVIKNLYLCGEILDVAGDCGGYNLGFAFLSGLIAGKAVGEKND